MKKPTVDEILELYDKLESTSKYGELYKEFREDERFYELDFEADLHIPVQFERDAIVLPTARDMVDSVIDHTDISHARVYPDKKGIGAKGKEIYEIERKFALGVLHRTNVESDISPQRVSGKHYWLHGITWIKTVWNVDEWISSPAKEDKETDEAYKSRMKDWRTSHHLPMPIIIKAVNPSCIMPDPFQGGRLWVFERHKRLLFDIKRMSPKWKVPEGVGDDEEVDYLEYWDKDFRCVLINREPALKAGNGVVPHKYGFIPYTAIESGLGNLSEDALPEKRYVGLIRYMKKILISESANYSMCDILMKWETMLGGYITGADAGTLGEIKMEYGLWWPVGDKDVKFNKWERDLAPEAAYAHLALTHDYIASHAAPRSMRGLSESGVRSGADRRLVLAEAQSKLNYSKDAFASGWANVLEKCARIAKYVIPEDFMVWGKPTDGDQFNVTVKRSMLREPFNFYVEFAPIAPEDEYRRHEDLMRMVQSGLYTKYFAWTRLSDVDPEAMQKQEFKELLRKSPAYLENS